MMFPPPPGVPGVLCGQVIPKFRTKVLPTRKFLIKNVRTAADGFFVADDL